MKKVVLGMSGGVDSSVCAALLKERGYDVIGLFMRNWHEENDDGICAAEQDFSDVKAVCACLNIPYYSVDLSREYQQRVFKIFVEEYKAGRTPNPDVLCNKEIKFDAFLKAAKTAGADYVATGHYAAITNAGGKIWLCRSKDEGKDQTYFLNQLSAAQLQRVLFPLGDLTKDEVRATAKKYGLPTAAKKDSTGVCFIGERNFRQFLAQYIPMKRGRILTLEGKQVGEHEGVFYYTVGQRKGLGIGGGHGERGEPWFVVKKDVAENVLYVAEGDSPVLYSGGLVTDGFNFITQTPRQLQFRCTCRIRHRGPLAPCTAVVQKGGVKVTFDEPQRGVAAGQYAVLYDGDLVLGGGCIAGGEAT